MFLKKQGLFADSKMSSKLHNPQVSVFNVTFNIGSVELFNMESFDFS